MTARASPVPRRTRVQRLGRAREEKRRGASPEALLQRGLGESGGLRALTRRQPVGLVENEQEGPDVRRDLFDERHFLTGDGRVGAEDDDRRVDVGTNARVASVLPARIDPIPGVSTRQRPDDRSGLGTNTSTASTPILFFELSSSATYAARRPTSMSRQAPPPGRTRARTRSPNRRTVGTDVTGRTPTGRSARPTSAFRSVTSRA